MESRVKSSPPRPRRWCRRARPRGSDPPGRAWEGGWRTRWIKSLGNISYFLLWLGPKLQTCQSRTTYHGAQKHDKNVFFLNVILLFCSLNYEALWSYDDDVNEARLTYFSATALRIGYAIVWSPPANNKNSYKRLTYFSLFFFSKYAYYSSLFSLIGYDLLTGMEGHGSVGLLQANHPYMTGCEITTIGSLAGIMYLLFLQLTPRLPGLMLNFLTL